MPNDEDIRRIARRYPKVVFWSDEDGCYIGKCPVLTMGGCHGDSAAGVLTEIEQIAEDWVLIHLRDGMLLPEPHAAAA